MVCCDSGKQVTDRFLVSQVIEHVVSKYKPKFESQHNGVVDFVIVSCRKVQDSTEVILKRVLA